jgi:FkbM family methyltransferase
MYLSELCLKALETLCEREIDLARLKIESSKQKKVVLFPAGNSAQQFFHVLLNDYGIEAEYFIDNNADQKTTVCGKPVKIRPWEREHNFKEERFIIIPTIPKFYFQITRQLHDAGIEKDYPGGGGGYMLYTAFWACQYWERYKNVLKLLHDEESKLAYLAAIYSMITYDNTFIQYKKDAYFAIDQFVENSYEIIVDAGAYVGDNVEEFVKRGVDGVKIYAFEPYGRALQKLEERVKRLKGEWFLNDDDIVIVRAGIGAESKNFNFYENNINMFAPRSDGEIEIACHSLDDFFKDKSPFTLLKADIEGGEMDMLRGAAKTIKRHKPKLALCIYHSPADMVQIAEYVHELVPEYHMAVRNHANDYRETVLYCWV